MHINNHRWKCTVVPPAAAVSLLIALTVALGAGVATSQGSQSEQSRGTEYPKRLKRSQSFLGIHFDFHARPDNPEIGGNTSREMIEAILRQVKPDYIQIDCKGHPGLSSYPTKVGNQAPRILGDPLRLWRQVTAEHGVSLYMHYSGVWDSEAVRKHPEWAAVDADNRPNPNITSVFGPYVDQLLIPQLKELAADYGVDGVWVDGECWAVVPDYSERVLQAFREQTGIKEVPRKKGDPAWFEFMEFNREAFRRYLRHYVDELKRPYTDFEIASNWAFSDHMPEPVTANVDFLSGDFTPQNSLNSARFSARCLANQGKPWDLMSWSFSGPQAEPARPLKSVPQLQQEAAIVLAQGGGYQAYFRQKLDGSIYDWQMKLMAEVARFCRERQPICHRAEMVPQAALLYSRAAHYRQSTRLFAPVGSGVAAMRGVLQSLLDSQNAVQIVSEHHLAGRMSQWPLIVVPEWGYLDPEFRQELVQYVRDGGSLLLVGPRTAALFQKELDVELLGEAASSAIYLEQNGWLAGLNTPMQKVKLGAGARPFGRLHRQDDPRGAFEPAASVAALGKGRIGATYIGYGERYLNARTPVARDFLQALVRELFPSPLVQVTGTHNVDVTVARNQGRLLINLINTGGPHDDARQYVFDEIPHAGPLEISIRLDRKPRSIVAQPGGEAIHFDYRDGQAKVRVPQLAIHTVLVIAQ